MTTTTATTTTTADEATTLYAVINTHSSVPGYVAIVSVHTTLLGACAVYGGEDEHHGVRISRVPVGTATGGLLETEDAPAVHPDELDRAYEEIQAAAIAAAIAWGERHGRGCAHDDPRFAVAVLDGDEDLEWISEAEANDLEAAVERTGVVWSALLDSTEVRDKAKVAAEEAARAFVGGAAANEIAAWRQAALELAQ